MGDAGKVGGRSYIVHVELAKWMIVKETMLPLIWRKMLLQHQEEDIMVNPLRKSKPWLLFSDFSKTQCENLKNLAQLFQVEIYFLPRHLKLDCLQSVSLSFLYQNNTRKEHAGHEIRTRTARRIGTRRDGSTSLFSPVLPPHFANALAWDLNHSTDLKRKGGLQAVYLKLTILLTDSFNALA